MLPAIQSVVDRGIVDENAIGIQGHSWGGYQIAYMVTQTKRFKAVAAGAPVVRYDQRLRRHPLGHRPAAAVPIRAHAEPHRRIASGSIPTRFIENSPIFWADRVATPVMILQNDGDDAVPWYQGIEFFLALRRLGQGSLPVQLQRRSRTALSDRPDQKDYTIRLQQYFDHYLKGAPAPDWMEKGVPFLQKDHTALSTLGPGGQ